MKKIFLYLFALSFLGGITGCQKTATVPTPADLDIVLAVNNLSAVLVNFAAKPSIPYYQNQIALQSHSWYSYGLQPGNNPVVFVNLNDSTQIVTSLSLNLKSGSIYSLFLAGSLPKIDTLFIKDNIPNYTDSLAGVRFVNLCSDSQPISIHLAGSAATEFTNLGYKKVSAFKSYSAKSTDGGSYTFEVHDVATGTLLTTFSWPYRTFRNNTLVVAGLEADNSINVFSTNNF